MQLKRTRNIFIGITLFTTVFSIIYEYFGHGVFSGFMMYAMLIPLMGVVVPYTLALHSGNLSGKDGNLSGKDGNLGGKDGNLGGKDGNLRQKEADPQGGSAMARSIYQSAVLTFLMGSIFAGVLEIYGTTNRLLSVYWIAGMLLLVAAAIVRLRAVYSH